MQYITTIDILLLQSSLRSSLLLHEVCPWSFKFIYVIITPAFYSLSYISFLRWCSSCDWKPPYASVLFIHPLADDGWNKKQKFIFIIHMTQKGYKILYEFIFMNSEFIFMNSEKWFHSFVYGHEFIYDDYNFMTRIHGWFYKHKSMSYMLWPINSDMSSYNFWTLTTCCICIGGYLVELKLPGVLFPNSSGIKAAAKTHLKWRILKNMFEFRGYQCSRDQKPWKLSHKSTGTIETFLIW